jgi:hypothetical protein
MSSPHPTIARIRLSRSLPRLLALPTLGLLAGLAAIGAGLLLVAGTLGLVVAGAGAALAVLSIVGFALPLSVRLEIEESAVRVSWLGGERIYVLSPGPVTRVRLRGENASSLRGGRRLLGGQFGSARLRGEEQIDVVRLAPTATAILIPTDRGRLAIAAASEELLLDALSHAARARQRLEELERELPPAEEPPAPVEIEVDPALMTGIERALHERQVAEERDAAEAAALARLAAAEAAAIAEAEAAEAATEAQAPTAAKPRRRLGLPLARPRPSTALVLLPLVGAGAAWGIGLMLDRMPDPGSEVGRLTALALVLAGPAATVGAIMARVWWPRLVGVVVAGGLAAAVFVGRSLIGA